MNNDKACLIIINRAYLTSSNYKENNKLTLILHDECHNATSNKCNEFLTYFHKENVPIVGFSATPLRTGNNDLNELKKIYGKNNNLNLLTDYNLIYAITKNLVLPPEFYWYYIDKNINKKNKELISNYESESALGILNNIIPKMPNRQIIAWCGKIDKAKKWKEKFEEDHTKYKNMEGFKFFIDTSEDSNVDYENFCKYEKHTKGAILFCASKHREGSDIPKLDTCIFLDGVQKRGPIPFIQSKGRALRIDNTVNINVKVNIDDNNRVNTDIKINKKKNGIIIEGIYKNDDYEMVFVDKIIGYYFTLDDACISDKSITDKSSWDKYTELKRIITFDKDKEVIEIKIKDKFPIKINLNNVRWNNIVSKFDTLLQQKCNLSCGQNMIHKGKILVKDFGFNKNTDFVNEYNNISYENKLEYNLPDIKDENYEKLFVNKTWFDFL